MTTTPPASTRPSTFPPRPRLVLRVGFAGRRELTAAEHKRLESTLTIALGKIGHQLAALIPGVPVESGREPRVAAFFDQKRPLLRLVTGLCEGADALAANVLDTIHVFPDAGAACGPDTPCLETELAAVLPFDVETYRRSRPAAFHPEFDRHLQRCAWVLELDGIYEKPSPDTPRAQNRRARAYRAQSAFLLRHSDILIAAANPDEPGKSGGTLETVREALAFELPVVFIHTGREGENVYPIGPDDDLHSVLADPPPTDKEWENTLQQWIRQLVADPDNGLSDNGAEHREVREQGEALLREYFDEPATPRRDAAGNRRTGFREWVWSRLERRFRTGPDSKRNPALEPYATYRKRATDLNYHYSGQYRGAYLLNYAAAITAVVLAAVSLTLLGTAGHTPVTEPIAALLESAGHLPAHAAVALTPKSWLLPVLLVLATLKLATVAFILFNTHCANANHWNDRAVDYRYLAERLRGMFYLPLAGSHQPPAADPPQFACRVVRQSTVDWLFDSLVRAISPADLPHAAPRDFPANAERGGLTVKKLLTLRPKETAEEVRDAWVSEQAKYHERNSRTMQALEIAIESGSKFLSWTVIAVVAVDLLLLAGKVLHCLPEGWVPFAKTATPWFIFTSAVLPAIVAALGGVRFQSECQRLAERSAVMRVLLAGREPLSQSQQHSWWRRLGIKFIHLGKNAWLILRRLCGLLPEPTGFQPNGGRWHRADAVANRIRIRQAAPETDPGSWAHDTLRLTEHIATDFVQEAAEWSVLYAKEVSDPG